MGNMVIMIPIMVGLAKLVHLPVKLVKISQLNAHHAQKIKYSLQIILANVT